MILQKDEKVHVINRRLFESDIRRHFAGTVEFATEQATRLRGYVFVWEPRVNQFQKRKELRTRIISLVDASLIINVLPAGVDIEQLRYEIAPPENHLVITDGEFSLDINEFGSTR